MVKKEFLIEVEDAADGELVTVLLEVVRGRTLAITTLRGRYGSREEFEAVVERSPEDRWRFLWTTVEGAWKIHKALGEALEAPEADGREAQP
jgi:hypothetical protein